MKTGAHDEREVAGARSYFSCARRYKWIFSSLPPESSQVQYSTWIRGFTRISDRKRATLRVLVFARFEGDTRHSKVDWAFASHLQANEKCPLPRGQDIQVACIITHSYEAFRELSKFLLLSHQLFQLLAFTWRIIHTRAQWKETPSAHLLSLSLSLSVIAHCTFIHAQLTPRRRHSDL